MFSLVGVALRPLRNRIWNSAPLRARNLLRFAEIEADGGRDIVRAAEVTADSLLRRLFIRHALDEQRHAELFRRRGTALILSAADVTSSASGLDFLSPAEHGLDDLRVEQESDESLLAFLHLSEKSAAASFKEYSVLLDRDPTTRALFQDILRDEVFHVRYTLSQLERVTANRHSLLLWKGRANRLWKAYLRTASAIAGVISGIVLTIVYFMLLPPFALLARRAARREAEGWATLRPERADAMTRQY